MKNLNREQMVKDCYYMAGMLEGLSCQKGQALTEAMAYMLADCVDRLELMGAALLAKDVTGDEGRDEEGFPLS